MCPIFVKSYSRYLDYYLLTPKVVITLTRRAKLTDIRAILNTRVEVSVITLNATIRFEIPITYSLGMALRTIISNKSRFVSFVDNVPIMIRNSIIQTRFYIIDCPRIKIILGFLFFRKARVTFRYLRDDKDRPVFALLYDPRTGGITTVKTNTKTEKARETLLA